MKKLYSDIQAWVSTYLMEIFPDAQKFIRRKLVEMIVDPVGYFYLTIKLHKYPISTCPFCSDCASLPHALGQWVDEQLQPIVKGQSKYFKNSTNLKKELNGITLSAHASIFTYNTISMYTNINPEDSIARISKYLHQEETRRRFSHKNPEAIVDDMSLVMRNNRMHFGNIIVHQTKGIAMGMSLAPTIANLFVAIFEAKHIAPLFGTYLLLLQRFIYGKYEVWIHNPDPAINDANWLNCQAVINAMGLFWEFTKCSQKVIFMDLTIKIIDKRFVTLLYAKPMALYLYIPPNSSHAPGIFTGLVYKQVLRIYQLCSQSTDIDIELASFYCCLLARGHHPRQLIPLLKKVVDNACTYLSHMDDQQRFIAQAKEAALQQQIFFHLPFHPQLPPSAEIQRLWCQHISAPPGQPPLHQPQNAEGYPFPVKQLVIAYRRDLSLGNVFTYLTRGDS
jgi:hypothetical protein